MMCFVMADRRDGWGTLYVVGTPIGNLGDLTDRARETLGLVDVVAAEDTRRTGTLLTHLGIRAPRLLSLFEGNERERTGQLLGELRNGRDVAVVSDAGMPGVSDPGFRLVRACAEEGIDVRVVPGPSAAIAALVVSGLPTDRFVFEGFLPRPAGERRARLEALAREPRTIVLFESPRRVAATLREALMVLGDRPVAVARELTKLHEEVLRGSLAEVVEALVQPVRGEVAIVLGGASDAAGAVDPEVAAAEALALMRSSGARPRGAAAEVARRHGLAANDVYRAVLAARSASGPGTERAGRRSDPPASS
jgi:16S rRNA (cytidine1402-2'-O)-methyltransferase